MNPFTQIDNEQNNSSVAGPYFNNEKGSGVINKEQISNYYSSKDEDNNNG